MPNPNVGIYYDSDMIRYQLSNFKNITPLKDFTIFTT